MNITDQDIIEILGANNNDERGVPIGEHSDSSDDARRKILWLWSMETPLYGAVNRANQYQDQRAIKTLGPYARLLYMTIKNRPLNNEKKQAEKTVGIRICPECGGNEKVFKDPDYEGEYLYLNEEG